MHEIFVFPPWCIKLPKLVLDQVYLKKGRTEHPFIIKYLWKYESGIVIPLLHSSLYTRITGLYICIMYVLCVCVCVCVCVVWTCLSACISEYCLRVLNYNQLFDFINFEQNFHPAVQFTYHISDTSVTFLDIRSLKTHCGLNPVPTSPLADDIATTPSGPV